MILASSFGMKGVVDPHGKVLVPFRFDDLGPLHDSSPAATAREGDAWGVIDLTGEWILTPQFEDACLHGDRLLASVGGRWGMLDLYGRWIAEPVFDSIRFIGDRFNYFLIRRGDHVGVMDDAGWRLVEPEFEDVEEWGGVLQAQEDGRWGFLDKRGTWQVKPCFDSCCVFRNGLAPARRVDQNLLGIVNRSGEWVVPPRFAGLRWFEEDLASAAEADSPTSRWGFIDRQGTWAIPPVFAWVEDLSDGLAHACQADNSAHPAGRRHGFIDHRGQWAFMLDSNVAPSCFEDGLAEVTVNEPPLIVCPEVHEVFCDPQSGELIVEFAAPS